MGLVVDSMVDFLILGTRFVGLGPVGVGLGLEVMTLRK